MMMRNSFRIRSKRKNRKARKSKGMPKYCK